MNVHCLPYSNSSFYLFFTFKNFFSCIAQFNDEAMDVDVDVDVNSSLILCIACKIEIADVDTDLRSCCLCMTQFHSGCFDDSNITILTEQNRVCITCISNHGNNEELMLKLFKFNQTMMDLVETSKNINLNAEMILNCMHANVNKCFSYRLPNQPPPQYNIIIEEDILLNPPEQQQQEQQQQQQQHSNEEFLDENFVTDFANMNESEEDAMSEDGSVAENEEMNREEMVEEEAIEEDEEDNRGQEEEGEEEEGANVNVNDFFPDFPQNQEDAQQLINNCIRDDYEPPGEFIYFLFFSIL